MNINEYKATQQAIHRLAEIIRLIPLQETLDLIEDAENQAEIPDNFTLEEKARASVLTARFKELVEPMLAIQKARNEHRKFFKAKVNDGNERASTQWLDMLLS